MKKIFVLVEHRQGQIRDITFEMISKARQLCGNHRYGLTLVLLCSQKEPFIEKLQKAADQILIVQDKRFENYNRDFYKTILHRLIKEQKPTLTLIGHTTWGMNLAPALAISTGYPIATDCVDILLEEDRPKAIRQIYSGKVFAKLGFKNSEGYILTVRAGSFPFEITETGSCEILKMDVPEDVFDSRSRHIAFEDTGEGEIDISQADIICSVGRGLDSEEDIELIANLANKMGASLACSRPIVDKNWLPKSRQVGTSGKTVKPKVYLAFGISGVFQHMAGISNASTIIAVNKDKNAPIFRKADYGVISDLYDIAEALAERIEFRQPKD